MSNSLPGNENFTDELTMELAVRAAGLKLKTCLIQLQEGKVNYEYLALKHDLVPYLNIFPAIKKSEKTEENIAAVRASVELARLSLASGKYDLVILDEVSSVLAAECINAEEIRDIRELAYSNTQSLICMKSSAFMILRDDIIKSTLQ